MDKPKKTTVHSLSLPYPDPQWYHIICTIQATPSISVENEQAILHFLLPLLQPIGDFRREHVPRSKGKGRAGNRTIAGDSLPVWMPEVYDHLTVGFNSTVRRLESLARSRKPQILHADPDADPPEAPGVNLATVFVCRKSLPDIMTSSIPILIATSAPISGRARLVNVSAEAEVKIARALHQPRVGVLGIELGTVGAESLLHYIQENVPTLDVPWLDQAPTYQSVNVTIVVSTGKTRAAPLSRKRKTPAEG
ncbi:RNase P and RNase MRP subunit [Cladophialophora chaetospira]|uniref:RNase P and RNase MRP subunit n=1 Tax=Cladophialophora chaetospira TaxID=386627 RepID=A0AA39CHH4_9EURO|nr:RNase P and RNase MRP subunit [Cladophialophora chaetospira]